MRKLTQIIGLIVTLSFIACDKDRIEDPDPQTNSYQEADSYLDSKKQEEQEFVIENEDGNEPIQGNQNTRIWITKDCLEFPDGTPVDFPYTVKLVELYTPADMIYYQMPTVAGGQILETEGEVRIRAFKDDVELKLKDNCHFWVEIPSDDLKNYMSVYYGIDANDYIDWTDSPGLPNTPTPFAVSDSGYQSPIYRLGWVNCGSTVGTTSDGGLLFVSTTDDLTNVPIFVYIPEYKTVIQCRSQVSDLIPTGTDVKVIAIGVHPNNDLYHQYVEHNINGLNTIPLELTQISDADLTNLLYGL